MWRRVACEMFNVSEKEYYSTLKMEASLSSGMSVNIYEST
jgi:hypothetical protein